MTAYDVLGDIAIVEIVEENDKKTVACELLKHKNINVVLAKKGDVEGEFRVRDYELLGSREGRDFSFVPKGHRPEKLTETIHKESGCRFKVDPTVAYFSVRLGHERERIAKLVSLNEKVLVMFAGVGPYPITIAQLSDAKKVCGIELNPDAYALFKENIEINKLGERIEAIHGDAREEAQRFKEKFDRIVMPLPKESELFLDAALTVLKKGGTIHLYKICHEDEIDDFVNNLEKNLPTVRIDVVKAGAYAPGSWRYCMDIKTY
jgi:tRNA (guanine37-N1)-methyltransferase